MGKINVDFDRSPTQKFFETLNFAGMVVLWVISGIEINNLSTSWALPLLNTGIYILLLAMTFCQPSLCYPVKITQANAVVQYRLQQSFNLMLRITSNTFIIMLTVFDIYNIKYRNIQPLINGLIGFCLMAPIIPYYIYYSKVNEHPEVDLYLNEQQNFSNYLEMNHLNITPIGSQQQYPLFAQSNNSSSGANFPQTQYKPPDFQFSSSSAQSSQRQQKQSKITSQGNQVNNLASQKQNSQRKSKPQVYQNQSQQQQQIPEHQNLLQQEQQSQNEQKYVKHPPQKKKGRK